LPLIAIPLPYYFIYKNNLVAGGMPVTAKSFVERESFLSAQVIQNDIFNDYTADMLSRLF
jgi:hypothetical protein